MLPDHLDFGSPKPVSKATPLIFIDTNILELRGQTCPRASPWPWWNRRELELENCDANFHSLPEI